jgi:carbamoylphosphate synthase large subunit
MGTDMVDVDIMGTTVLNIPPATNPAMLGVLRRAVAEYGIDLLVPTVSEELPLIAAAIPGFGGAEVVVATPGPVALAHDKLLTCLHLSAHGILVPRFAVPSDVDGLDAARAALGHPFVAKPRVSRGGRGVTVVRSARDLAWDALDDGWILQEFAPGTEYAPVVYRTPEGDGGDDVVIVLEKTGLAGGEIGNATGVRRLCAGDGADVATVALAAVGALGLTGPVDLDVRRLPDGRLAVLEVNARFGANSAAAPELLDRVLTTFAARMGRAA